MAKSDVIPCTPARPRRDQYTLTQVWVGYLANVFCPIWVLDENVAEERLSQVTPSAPIRSPTYKSFPIS